MGPDHTGPRKKGGGDDVEYQLIKADILSMRRQNMTQSEIALATGYSQGHISKMLRKIFREMLDENGAEEVRATEVERIEKIEQRILKKLLAEDDDPEATISMHAVDRFIKLSTLKAQYVGAFAPKQLDMTVKQIDDDGEEAAAEAERMATITERFIELADRVAEGGYGSGVVPQEIVDAEVVSETTTDDDWSESEDEVGPTPVGTWVNGKFVPARLELAPAPPDEPTSDTIDG